MSIKQRQELISQHADLMAFGGDSAARKKVLNITTYWNTLQRPLIRQAYLPDWVIRRLYDIATSVRLMSKPELKFKETNNLLLPFGFKPLASGTNRRTFYHLEDTQVVLKIASDDVGRKDNRDEFMFTQHLIKPFCPKIFNIDGDGACSLMERGEPMTEYDYKFTWASDIFDLLIALLLRGLILEDVGSNFYKNFGIRMGFGPMIWDFPYVYKLDYRKLRCIKKNPITGEICGGEIDYAYSKGMSEICCTKCGTRYSARYLAEKVPSECINKIITERGKRTMFGTKAFKVGVVENGKVTRCFSEDTAAPVEKLPKRGGKALPICNVSPFAVQSQQQPVQQQEQVQQPAQPAPQQTQQPVAETQEVNNSPEALKQPMAHATKRKMVVPQFQAPQVQQSIQQQVMLPKMEVIPPSDPVTNPFPMHHLAEEKSPTDIVIDTILNDPNQFKIVYEAYQKHMEKQGKTVIPYDQAKEIINGNKAQIAAPINEPIVMTPPEGKVVASADPNFVPEGRGKKFKISLKREKIKGADGKFFNTVTPEEFKAIAEVAKSEVPDKLPPEPPTVQNVEGLEEVATPHTTVGPVARDEHYYKNGKRYYFYPGIIRNLTIQWLTRMEKQVGTEQTLKLAEKLEIEYVPSNIYGKKNNKRKVVNKDGSITLHKPSAVQVQNSPETSILSKSDPQEVVIAPPTGGYQPVAGTNPEKWKYRGNKPVEEQSTAVESEQSADSSVTQEDEKIYTPVKPMSQEDIERAEADNADSAVMGLPGQTMVETIRFKQEMPKIKAIVEARYNGFILDTADTDRQIEEMEKDIKEFIAEDVANIMATDTSAIKVDIKRTVDERNNDCFEVVVTNNSSPAFKTLIYPTQAQAAPETMATPIQENFQQTIAQTLVEEPEQPAQKQEEVPEQEQQEEEVEEDKEKNEKILEFFESKLGDFDTSGYKEVGALKEALRQFLSSALMEQDDSIGAVLAFKMANEYVNTQINIEDASSEEEEVQQPTEIKEGTVSENL